VIDVEIRKRVFRIYAGQCKQALASALPAAYRLFRRVKYG